MTQTSETTVPQTPARRLRVLRIPGDIMIYPMIVGLLLNTFCPQVFEIGGFFTAATRGGSNTIVAAVIITAVAAPILTGWVDKRFCQGGEDLSAAGVEAIEEAVARDVDGE